MALMSTRSSQEWLSEYAESHRHPANRFCHTIGIPFVALSVVFAFALFVVPSLWPLPLGFFVVVYFFRAVLRGVALRRRPAELGVP